MKGFIFSICGLFAITTVNAETIVAQDHFTCKKFKWICPIHGEVGETYDLMISTFSSVRFESDPPDVFRCPKCYWDALKKECQILKKIEIKQ